MKKLGKFEVLEEIGRGAMGVVYKARDPFIDRLVALKTLRPELAEDPALRERFYQEARSAGALEHPNIVTILEASKESNPPFIAMAFLEGGSLDKLIETHPVLPLSQKLGYIAYVCRALEYAHKRGVVHRDIKPGNVMVTADGTVRVVDFGIARLGDTGRTQTGTLIGTLGYMSPQLIEGKTADAKSDIWAVGVMFYELLAYQRPFNGENHYALMMNILSQPPPPISESAPGTPPDVADVIERMLRKNLDERFQSMEEILIELEPIWKRIQQADVSVLVADSKQLFDARDLGRAQDMLRKALLLDTANTQAKNLLEKINADIRRREIIPQVKGRVEKGENLLAAGQFEEAKAEAEAALHLDSTYLPARELLAQAQIAAERARMLAQGLRTTKKRLAEGAITEAELQLTKVLEIDAANVAAQDLLKQIKAEKSRREYQKRLSETLNRARAFWTELRYDECIQLLLEAHQKFPGEGEIDKLLETARQDKSEQERQTLLTQARGFLRAQQFDEALKVLDRVLNHSPADSTAKNLRMLALQGRQQQTRERRLREDLATLRAQVKDGKYQEAIARAEELLHEFPNEFELAELVAYARSEHFQSEQKRKLEQWIEKTNQGIKSGHFKDAIKAANSGLDEFPRDSGLMLLLDRAKKRQGEKEKREVMEQRIKDVETKMNREELIEAIGLAEQTLRDYGPDIGVSQILRQAEAKHEQQERKKKHDQLEVIQLAQTMVDAGNFGDATMILQREVETGMFPENDPRLVEIRRLIDEKQVAHAPGMSSSSNPATPSSGGATWADPSGDPGKDYVYQRTAPTHNLPVDPPSDSAASAIFSAASVTGPAIQHIPPPAPPMGPEAPGKSGKSRMRDGAAASLNEFSATKVIHPVTIPPSVSSQTTEIDSRPEIAPVRPALPSMHSHQGAIPDRKRSAPAALYVLASVLVVAAGAYLFLRALNHAPSTPETKVVAVTPPTSEPMTNTTSGSDQPSPDLPDAISKNLEKQQRLLISSAQRAVNGAKDYAGALVLLGKAHELNGPLQEEIEKYQRDYGKIAGQSSNAGTNLPGQTSPRPEPRPTTGPGGPSQVTIPAAPGGNPVAKDNTIPVIVDRPSQPPVTNPQPATPTPSQPGSSVAPGSETRVTLASPPSSPVPAPKTESTTVAANLAPANPAPVPPAPLSTDSVKIRQLLNTFAQAYSNKDTERLRLAWPKLTDKYLKSNQDSFKGAESIHMALEPCSSPQINGEFAIIACTQTMSVTVRGERQQDVKHTVTFYLKRSEDTASGWIVERFDVK